MLEVGERHTEPKGKEDITYFEVKKRIAFSKPFTPVEPFSKQGSFAEAARCGPALSTASVKTQVNFYDIVSSRKSPSHTSREVRTAAHSELPTKSGRASKKATAVIQEVASSLPANNRFKVRSLVQSGSLYTLYETPAEVCYGNRSSR